MFAGIVGAAAGMLPLFVIRTLVACRIEPDAKALDLWRVLYGDLEFWTITAFVGAVLMGVLRPVWQQRLRVIFHGFCTLIFLLSVVELAFLEVTGSRVDFDLLLFAATDLRQVFPVIASEVHWYHLVAVAAGVAIGMSPFWLRLAGTGSAWWGRVAIFLLLPTVVLEVDGARPRPAKALREAQASLVEQLWWDGIERVGDTETPPLPGETDGILLERGAARPLPNIVLVFLESIGAHSTTVYTPELGTTPNLAHLASRGITVDNASAVVPHTSKALITTLCGQYPKLVSEIREARPGGLPGRCLPELLGELGYRTAFLQTAYESFERRGDLIHEMGFDFFRSRDTLSRPGFQKVNYFGIEDKAMIAPGVLWSASSPQPFFAAYNTLTSHHDYGIPTDFPRLDIPGARGRREQYYNAVRYVDSFVGDLVRAYERAGLAENTLFILVGDHGEAFGEHGHSQHDMVIYEEGLRIPMVLYGPGVLGEAAAGTRIGGPRQQVDLAPTLLEMAGARLRRGELPGVSLFSEVPESRVLYHSCWRSHRCLAKRQDGTKFVDHYRDAPMQRFDLAVDPGETSEVRGESELKAALRGEVRGWRARVNGRYEALHQMYLERIQTPDDSPALANWGGKIDLLGCSVDKTVVVPSDIVRVACRWRARETMKMAWRISTRLEGNFRAAAAKTSPVDGLLPTFAWRRGWAVEDRFRVDIPAAAEPGEAVIRIGWERYGGDTIELEGGGEQVEVARIQVVAPEFGDPPAAEIPAELAPAPGEIQP